MCIRDRVIALASVKKNGSPFQTTSAAENSVLTSRHTGAGNYNDGTAVFFYIIAGLFILLIVGIVIILVLRKRHRRRNAEEINLLSVSYTHQMCLRDSP